MTNRASVERILREAASIVDSLDLQADLRTAAFEKAVDLLKSSEAGSVVASAGNPSTSAAELPTTAINDDDFYRELARESGAEETDIRDVLRLTGDREVQITTPTKDLGSSVAEQARAVIALVAGARGRGLGEQPVRADAVRKEAERKRCYQANNFAALHLRNMKGFNAGSRNEIVLTSRWVDEFVAAVNKAHGRSPKQS